MEGFELLEAAVAEALSGHRCVSGWIGYGGALFLGFGSEQIRERDADGQRTEPPYELQTARANWRVGCLGSADLDFEREAAERGLRVLIGRPVLSWRLIDCRGLAVEFVGGARLDVLPPVEADHKWSALDEWWFCLPGTRYVGVGGGGRMVDGHTDRPINSDDAGPPSKHTDSSDGDTQRTK